MESLCVPYKNHGGGHTGKEQLLKMPQDDR